MTTATTAPANPDATFTDECDAYYEALHELMETHNIHHSHWSYDDCEKPIRDFSQKHPFTAKWIDSGCNGDDHCYAVHLCGMKPTEPVELLGDTWLDVWKSIDRHIAQKECGHRFIELIEEDGDTLIVHCGS